MGDVLGFIAGEIHQHLGSPPATVLKPDDTLGAALRGLRFYKHQLGIVGNLITGKSFEVDATARQFPIYDDGLNEAVYVERLVDSVNNLWVPVDIVPVRAVNSEEQGGDYSIAFFGAPDWQALISWDPQFDQTHLRIWHDPDDTEVGTISDDIGVPLKLASSMIVERGALECVVKCRLRDKETWDVNTVKLFIDLHTGELARLESEWDMWRFHSGESGLSQQGRFDRYRRGVGRRLPVMRAG